VVDLRRRCFAAHQGAAPAGLTALDYLGAAVWIVGFFFESAVICRWRASSRSRNKGKLNGPRRVALHTPSQLLRECRNGGASTCRPGRRRLWTIFSPILMTLLLLRVSGVALLEKTLETRPDQRVRQRTSAFIPWPPRRS